MNEDTVSALKRFALDELGFALVGVAPAGRLPGSTHLRRWLRSGAHAGMRFMAETSAVRGDPRRFMRGARSVVCVAMSHHDPPHPGGESRAPRALVATYARRADYHSVIRRRLVRLGRALADALPGTRWQPAVDTAPLLERELAEQAGLGWIGKNTCLINRSLGSELLLGELVTDAALPPDRPATDHCGSCSACLQACPTGALAAPGWLDCARCISYLTIEHRARFGPRQARAVGLHLFGCDICQAVCPWNVKMRSRCSSALAARAHLNDPPLAVLRRLDSAGWASFSAGSPLRRLSFARFRRNLAAVTRNAEADLPLEDA